ncbi:MAG: metallophosphoesterase [Myxococcota bacterium]|nr:metallophosphoesterase [Myxococcota bacterium]
MARTLIVGDIHGCYQELLQLLDVAGLRDDDVLISVGDVVDRGPEPLAVIELFRSRPRSLVLMGNHERKHVREVFSYAQQITRLQLGERYAECVAWMKSLPYFYETPEIRIVHAAMVPGVPLAEQDEDILAGTTSGEHKLAAQLPSGHWHDHYTDPTPIVFGHHVVGRDPLITPNGVYGIDTGACHGWRLTALSVPDFTLHAVDARADHWAAVKAAWQLPVLAAKPWLTMSWSSFDAELARFGAATGDARAYLDELAGWAHQLRTRAVELVAAAHATAERIEREVGRDRFTAAARAHPAAALIFQARSGRLDRASLMRVCSTPRKTYDLARQLGVAVEPLQSTDA